MNPIDGPLLSIRTPPFAHYSIAWSPFHPRLLAFASSANYGLIGNGRLHVARINAAGGANPHPTPQFYEPVPGVSSAGLQLDKFYKTQDGLYDLAWSEIHENQLVTASGDGSIKLWDIMLNDLPIMAWHEHTREVFSVDWSNIEKTVFASSSWDGLVKIWTPERPQSIQTIVAHNSCVYQALFSPHSPQILATCSTDGTVKLFDLRQPNLSAPPSVLAQNPAAMTGSAMGQQAPHSHPAAPAALTIPAHSTEVLTLDWNKYRPWVIATGSVDRSIKIWDCRNVKQLPDAGGAAPGLGTGVNLGGAQCEMTLPGHEYAVRKVQWSPHRPDALASASYDMTCRVWSANPHPARPPLRGIHDKHTEFVAGCAWSLYDEGMLASCSWDHSVHLFRPNVGP